MKKLHTFESFSKKPIYNIGDYVYYGFQIRFLAPSPVGEKKYQKRKVRIIDKRYVESLDEYQYLTYDGDERPTLFGKTGSIISNKVWVLERHIKRYLTPEEIEEFKLKEDSKKYNL